MLLYTRNVFCLVFFSGNLSRDRCIPRVEKQELAHFHNFVLQFDACDIRDLERALFILLKLNFGALGHLLRKWGETEGE